MVITSTRLTKAQNDSATGLHDSITSISVGDGITTPSVSDTILVNETYNDALYNKSVASNIVNADIRLDVTENNGNDINEIGMKDGSSVLESRDLTTPFSKTSDKEAFYRIKTTFMAVNV